MLPLNNDWQAVERGFNFTFKLNVKAFFAMNVQFSKKINWSGFHIDVIYDQLSNADLDWQGSGSNSSAAFVAKHWTTSICDRCSYHGIISGQHKYLEVFEIVAQIRTEARVVMQILVLFVLFKIWDRFVRFSGTSSNDVFVHLCVKMVI